MVVGIVLLVLLASVLVLWVVGARQRLLQLRAAAVQAFAGVEARLRERHERAFHLVADATPLLAPHSSDVLARLTNACDESEQALQAPRRQGLPAATVLDDAEGRIRQAAQDVLEAVAPHVDGQARTLALQEFARRDADIAAATGVYNGLAQQFNAAAREWPTCWVAAGLRLHAVPALRAAAPASPPAPAEPESLAQA